MKYGIEKGNFDTGGRSEKGAMYDVGDEEDKEIAKKQEKDAQKRDEMPDDEQDVKDEPREG